MINLSKDEAFNQMVKDISKLKIVLVDNKKASFKKEDINKLKQGIHSESYKDMVQIRQGKGSYSIFVREENEKPVGFSGIVYSEDETILVDLEGYISPATIQQLINGKINFGAISKIYDISKVGNSNPRKKK